MRDLYSNGLKENGSDGMGLLKGDLIQELDSRVVRLQQEFTDSLSAVNVAATGRIAALEASYPELDRKLNIADMRFQQMYGYMGKDVNLELEHGGLTTILQELRKDLNSSHALSVTNQNDISLVKGSGDELIQRTTAIETSTAELDRRISAIDVSLKAVGEESKNSVARLTAIDTFMQSDPTPKIHEICTGIMSDPTTTFNIVQVNQEAIIQGFQMQLEELSDSIQANVQQAVETKISDTLSRDALQGFVNTAIERVTDGAMRGPGDLDVLLAQIQTINARISKIELHAGGPLDRDVFEDDPDTRLPNVTFDAAGAAGRKRPFSAPPHRRL
jgi:hypothetical protein